MVQGYDNGQRDKNGGTRGALNDDAKIPQDEMVTLLPVIWTKTSDAAPTIEEVIRVEVWEGDGVGTKVESGSRPNALFKAPMMGGVERIILYMFIL